MLAHTRGQEMHTTRVKAQKNRAAITIAVCIHMNKCREQGAEVLKQLVADEQLATEWPRLLSKEQGKCQPFWIGNNNNKDFWSWKAAAWR